MAFDVKQEDPPDYSPRKRASELSRIADAIVARCISQPGVWFSIQSPNCRPSVAIGWAFRRAGVEPAQYETREAGMHAVYVRVLGLDSPTSEGSK